MRTFTPEITAHVASEVTTLATCISITRNDGLTINLTDFNKDLNVSGVIYQSGCTFNMSAFKSSTDLSVDNANLDLGIDGTIFTKADFQNDLFKRARFYVFSVNWQDPSSGTIDIKRGFVGDVTVRDESYVSLSLRGLTQALQRNILDQYSPSCRAEFGDKKCGMVIDALSLRRSGASYKIGEWINVLDAGVETDCLIANGSFEANGTVAISSSPAITGWTVRPGSSWGVASGTTPAPLDGSYALSAGVITPADAVNALEQRQTLAQAGMTNANVDAGKFALYARVSIAGGGIGRIRLNTFDVNGILIQSAVSKVTVSTLKWQEINVGLFVKAGARSYEVVLESIGSDQVYFDNAKTFFTSTNTSATRGIIFKSVRAPGRVIEDEVKVLNYRFASNVVTPWVAPRFSVVSSVPGLAPFDGGYFALSGDDGSTTPLRTYPLSQTVNIASQVKSTTASYVAEFAVALAQVDASSSASLSIEFLDKNNTLIDTYTFNPVTFVSFLTWETKYLRAKVPANAANIRLTVNALSGAAASAAGIAVGSARAYIFNTAQPQKNDPLRGDTAATPPAFDFTLGNYTYDGDIIWQAFAATSGYDVVSSNFDNRVFNGTTIEGGDFAFYGARITWLSGRNAGRSSYVRTWVSGTKTLKLYQPLAYSIQPGDKFAYSLGCNKTIEDCSLRFNNAINFRGEPFLPGTSKALQYFANQT